MNTKAVANAGPCAPPAEGTPSPGEEERLYSFANLLAHEIRNPLNALSLNLALLGREIKSEESRAVLEAARKEVTRLDGLLGAFLRFARPRKPSPRPLGLSAVLRELELFIAPEAAKRGVELVFRAPEKSTLVTDSDLLKQALLNIILNSFEAGARKVEVATDDRGAVFEITVRDDGPGLAEPARALEPFYSTKAEGTGLGLPTARHIATALGGDLRLGAPPAGAEVILTIAKGAARP